MNRKKINIEDLYKIIGNISEESLKKLRESDKDKHPKYPNQDAYIEHVRTESIKQQLEEKYISVKKQRGVTHIHIGDMNVLDTSVHKITIKDLLIDISSCAPKDGIYSSKSQYQIFLDALPFMNDPDPLNLKYNGGVTIAFENNHFVSAESVLINIEFLLGNGTYLIFDCNKFNFFNMVLTMDNKSSMARLTSNTFNTSLLIKGDQKGVVVLQDNIIPHLTIEKIEYSFKGRNRIDELDVGINMNPLYWGPYQNIDPQGKHALRHKKMFIKLKTKAIQNNDKMQEAILHRELLKCDRVLIQKENPSHSLQDRFIFGWSSLISDYGISWIRPLLLLTLINALLTAAIVIFYFFNPECLPKFSYDKWWFLFAELFSPLSNLSNLTTKGGWIAFINVAQKVILAAAYYEIIKIFRRFSK